MHFSSGSSTSRYFTWLRGTITCRAVFCAISSARSSSSARAVVIDPASAELFRMTLSSSSLCASCDSLAECSPKTRSSRPAIPLSSQMAG